MKVANIKFFCLVLLIISIPSGYRIDFDKASGDNLVKNWGFEEKGEGGLPKGWRIIPAYKGKGKATLDGKSVHSGKYSLRLKPNKKNIYEAFGIFMILDPAKLQGKDVTISGFAKHNGLGEYKAAGILIETDRKNYVILPKLPENEFFHFSKTFSIANSIPAAALLLLIQGTKGSVWFDDLSLKVTKVTTTSSIKGKVATLKPSDNEFIYKINTPGWQDSVFISPDGKELYFAYVPYVQKDFMDIIFGKISEKDVKVRGPIRPGSHGKMNFETYKAVKREDGTWGKPINLNINSSYSLYSAKLSYDGSELYFAIRDYQKNYGADDIYVSKKLPDGNWAPPKNLGPNINTRFREDTPCLSADGNTIYFGRNRGEMLGWEIMVSMRDNGQWTRAEKLGPPINEPKPETTANYQPFISSDGKEFYFTRIQQLYMSKRKPDGSWGEPGKVFPHLAVSGHASVTADGRYLYFLTAKDKESLKRQHWTIWYSERQKDGSWGDPKPVD
jgi:hypothetical protein